jgi:peroxiredoxin Q/BCP
MVKTNDKAPDFKAKALVNNEEKEISLSDFKGKKIAMYFYPKDLTPGCTTQACNLRDNYSNLEKEGIVVIGVSKDSIKSHIKFANEKELPFILVSDEDLKVNNLYGVWVEKSMYGRKYMGTNRNTFLIDEDFKIVDIIEKPKVGEHSKEILEGFK